MPPQNAEARTLASRLNGLFLYYRENGFAALIRRIQARAAAAWNDRGYARFTRTLKGRDPESVFSEIYEKSFWKTGESLSGAGSELAYTENLRGALPELFARFGVRRIVDAPCGDYHWMRLVPLPEGATYVGLDIVPRVIEENQRRYGDERRRFAVANLARDPLPAADLLICRDCLFHLSNADVAAVLRNFAASKIPYLLTSTHVNDGFRNSDIQTGEFRRLDLFSEPFRLPQEVLHRIEDFMAPFPPREMCLWTREQVEAALSAPPEARSE